MVALGAHECLAGFIVCVATDSGIRRKTASARLSFEQRSYALRLVRTLVHNCSGHGNKLMCRQEWGEVRIIVVFPQIRAVLSISARVKASLGG